MRRDHLPHVVGVAVLIVGLVVGIAFAAVSVSAVLGGLLVLAGSMAGLCALSKRGDADEPDEIADLGPLDIPSATADLPPAEQRQPRAEAHRALLEERPTLPSVNA
ncbi:hypothetical protein CLV71_11739 [Actinophytocola oryzae]|uniref:Uncharacterized protein n=2 Tax=Actinophytocola oryzae TaxID=502181 RepID=A0A4R7V166_9PSEU|nr:hypothetical protein CLV71_11739 [Actinophytocola oryzae]